MSISLSFVTGLLVAAGVTYLVRMVPLVLVKKKIQNRFIRSFLYYIPYTVLTAMTFPAALYATNSMLSAAIGLAVAVAFAIWGKDLTVVALASCVAVYISECVIGLF